MAQAHRGRHLAGLVKAREFLLGVAEIECVGRLLGDQARRCRRAVTASLGAIRGGLLEAIRVQAECGG